MTTSSTTSTWAAPRRTLASTSITAAPSSSPAAVVLAGVVLGVATLFGSVRVGPAVAIAVVMAVAVVAATVDARTGRIPDRLVGVAGCAVLAGTLAAAAAGTPLDAVGTISGTVVFAGPLLVCHLLAPASIGFGDVKLAAVSGAALGLVDARLGMAALCIAAGSTAAIGMSSRRPQLPFGPGLVFGSVAALAIHGWLPA